jgi:hypothetical protein
MHRREFVRQFHQVEYEMRFKQKHYCFKQIFLAQRQIITALIMNGNILFRGELTGELTETRADWICRPWIV